MKLLLDTHAFLWFVLDEPRLSARASTLVADPQNTVLISPATDWEIAIKIRLGKYALPEPYHQFMEREIATNRFDILPIEVKHTALLTTLPRHHNDPFDRLLIAQAIVEATPVLSIDEAFDPYGVVRLW